MLPHQILLILLAPFLGSFSTVLFSRGIAGQSIFFPARSYCDNCKETLSWKEKIPLFSYLKQKSRCMNCGKKIDINIFLIEIFTTFFIIVIGSATSNLLNSILLSVLAVFTAPILIIDFLTKKIPNSINIMFLAAVTCVIVVASFISAISFSTFFYSVAISILILFFYLFLFLVSRGGMGFGDVKLSLPIAILCSFFSWQQAIVATIFAFFLGGIYGVIQIILFNASRKHQVPFAPFMLVGAWLALIIGTKASQFILNFWSFS